MRLAGSHTLFLFASLSFSCAGARGVVIFGLFSVRLALCAVCSLWPSLGKERTMRRTCSGAEVPGCVVQLSMKLQTPGLPEGQKKGRLGFFSSLYSCPLFAPHSTSRSSLFYTPPNFSPKLTLFAILELVETAAVQPAHWHPTLSTRPFPSIMAECSPLFAGSNFKLSGSVTLKLGRLPNASEKPIMCHELQ